MAQRAASLRAHLADLVQAAEPGQGPGYVSLRTLVWLRWVALLGQTATVLFVAFALGFELPLGGLTAAIGAGAGVNLLALLQRRRQPRIADGQAFAYIAFDTVQLAALLFLTGGLVNPFVILLVAPVAMGATVLSRRHTLGLTLLALGLLILLALTPMPLPWRAGGISFPPLYLLGVWFAMTVATVVVAAYAWRVAEDGRRMAEALSTTQLALNQEQRIAALGALAAATAHELGSPLSTIALAAKEIAHDLPADDPLQEDVALVREQAERCRTILAGLAERPMEASAGEGGQNRRRLSEIVEQAAQPHLDTRSDLALKLDGRGQTDEPEPAVPDTPELRHGLSNLVQNAARFARTTVWVTVTWQSETLRLTIADDGPGFPQWLLSRLDEPFLGHMARDSQAGSGDNGTHLGLGIFIARTLLGRTGATLKFVNRKQGGAQVVVAWQRPI